MGAENRICVEYEGKLYCWDYKKKCFIAATVEKVPANECPECVIAAIFEKMRDDRNKQD
jgi:hypothetical protein